MELVNAGKEGLKIWRRMCDCAQSVKHPWNRRGAILKKLEAYRYGRSEEINFRAFHDVNLNLIKYL